MTTVTDKQNQVNLLSVEKDIRVLVEENVQVKEKQECDDPVFIVNLGDIIMKHKQWTEVLPSVEPFYAVKSNDDPMVLKLLADMGLSFDCASKSEIAAVLELGVSSDRIVYANPCKQASMLKYAAEMGVSLMAFDNESELYKTKRLYPDARLLIRILPQTTDVPSDEEIKFGCLQSRIMRLLQLAKSLGLNVIGVSFYIGSRCKEPNAYSRTIKKAREVFDLGKEIGFSMEILDLGGGFLGEHEPLVPFTEFANAINESLHANFPAHEGVRIIAEPGTYFVQSSCTLLVNIISKRTVYKDQSDDVASVLYYINDGVFGSYGFLKTSGFASKACIVKKTSGNEVTHKSKIWGPTLTSLDEVIPSTLLPDLDVGQWLYFENMGAYTIPCRSRFNGMPQPKCVYYCVKQLWQDVYPPKSV